ncbi:MaoC family dehydratase [Shimia sp. MMG029]|uniref:MaoC family dehydratase n=1 Tax=Shimia sp. MMG029 TaxID=3021978 RepID=UPI0022FE56B0|nr:MaoC/PaaZ C-terminal domain-containing protein [Shimia sp. MMG029]MDA5559047.1 MaoC/PaaZ C-terminal domain-containing protein [Shimia sp. MMG029]
MTQGLKGAALPPGVYGYDDLAIGDWIDAGSAQVTTALIDQFAAVSGDHYALHMDADFAAERGFANRVAHGLLVLSMVDGLKNNAAARLDGLVSMGWNWRFEAPVLAGDQIQAGLTIVGKRKTSSGDKGVLRTQFDVTNQDGDLVQSGTNELLFVL